MNNPQLVATGVFIGVMLVGLVLVYVEASVGLTIDTVTARVLCESHDLTLLKTVGDFDKIYCQSDQGEVFVFCDSVEIQDCVSNSIETDKEGSK